MMKPNVGLTVLTSSFMTLFTIVVFPALSSPLSRSQPCLPLKEFYQSYSIRIRISLSFSRALRSMDSILFEAVADPDTTSS